MNNEQDIDKLFRRGLTDPVNETGFREADWDDLEQMLDGGKKRRGIVYWLPVISSVAAMLLLVLGWWLFKPQQTKNDQKAKQIVAINKSKQSPKTNGTETLTGSNTTTSGIDKPSVPQNSVAQAAIAETNKPGTSMPVNKTGRQNTYARNTATQKTGRVKNTLPHINVVVNSPGYIEEAPVVSPVIGKINTSQLTAYYTNAVKGNSATNDELVNGIKPATQQIDNSAYLKYLAAQRNKEDVVTKSSLKHPQFALSIMGAPEVNGVNSFEGGKTGASAGLLFSVNMNKLTISTGIGYAKKPYNTSFENYHSTGYTFRTYPTNVIADCRAIDIPLNVDYQLFNKHQNKISVGTGVSSYLMMHENYQYEYADPAARGPRNYTIAKPGRYLFGVLNFQATYQRQINSKIGINVQPYLKLPLTNIGASQVKLQSAGVALGVSWNINSLTKP